MEYRRQLLQRQEDLAKASSSEVLRVDVFQREPFPGGLAAKLECDDHLDDNCPPWDHELNLYLCLATASDEEEGRGSQLGPPSEGTLHLHTWQHYTVSLVFWFRRSPDHALLPFRQIALWGASTPFDLGYNPSQRPRSFEVPLATRQVVLSALITGHGWGVDEENCAEFCEHSHHFAINGMGGPLLTKLHPTAGNEDGCKTQVLEGVVPNQYGTWPFGRAGWCPGQQVNWWEVDVTHWLQSETNTITYKALFNGTDYDPEPIQGDSLGFPAEIHHRRRGLRQSIGPKASRPSLRRVMLRLPRCLRVAPRAPPAPWAQSRHFAVVRHDWKREEIGDIYHQPLLELVFQAASVHRQFFDPKEVQQSTLLSIKTGGCGENCGYCSQSQSFKTSVKPTHMMKVDEVLEAARKAKDAGSTRFCMGTAWRGHYPNIVSTRTYADRLETLANVREAEHPESVPINALVPIEGTPLGDRQIKMGTAVTWRDMVRSIATARIVMPQSMVRLSAGRMEFSQEAQAMMFMAGANSIFTGDKLLTTANPKFSEETGLCTAEGLSNIAFETLFHYPSPESPASAAEKAGAIPPEDAAFRQAVVESLARGSLTAPRFRLVETAGGPLSPGPNHTFQADIYAAWWQALKARKQAPKMILFVGSEGQHSNAVAVQRALPEVPVVSIPQVPPLSEPLTNWVALKDVADGMSQVLRVMKGEIPGDEEHLQGAKQEVQVEHLQIDQNHLWHPYTSMVKPGRVWSVRSAEGCLIQLEDGRRLVDGMASWWCAIHGYNVPELNAAAANQLGQMSHVMFGGLTHRPATLLAKQLLDCAPEGLTQVFLCDSGSVSVEVALKMSLQYWAMKGKPSKCRIATVQRGYHGDTFGAMSVCDPVRGMHTLFKGALAQQLFAEPPELSTDWSTGDDGFSSMESLLKERHQEVAAVIIEPVVQGAGGMRIYNPSYLQKLRKLCDELDVLLIFDEIATGFGRTGKLFAAEHAQVSPDIMCIGKALTGGYCTLGAAIASEKEQLVRELRPLAAYAEVEDVRVLGAIGVVELKTAPAEPQKLQAALVDQGVWLRPFGRTIYTMPPFVISSEELSRISGAIASVLDAHIPRIQIQSLIYPLVNTPWAEELEPKNSAVLSGRGACELELGQKVEAAVDFRNALVSNPKDAFARAWLVKVREEIRAEVANGQALDMAARIPQTPMALQPHVKPPRQRVRPVLRAPAELPPGPRAPVPIIEASPISPEQAATTEASAHEAQPAQEPGEDAEALAFGGATGSEAPTALPEAPAAVVPAASTQETARRPESPQSGSLEAGEVHKAPPPTSDAQDATPIAEVFSIPQMDPTQEPAPVRRSARLQAKLQAKATAHPPGVKPKAKAKTKAKAKPDPPGVKPKAKAKLKAVAKGKAKAKARVIKAQPSTQQFWPFGFDLGKQADVRRLLYLVVAMLVILQKRPAVWLEGEAALEDGDSAIRQEGDAQLSHMEDVSLQLAKQDQSLGIDEKASEHSTAAPEVKPEPQKAEEKVKRPPEPLTTLDDQNFDDRGVSTLDESKTFYYTLGNDYRCLLTGWTHTRPMLGIISYAKGFIRNKPGTGKAVVSGLDHGVGYFWKVYQAKNKGKEPKYDEVGRRIDRRKKEESSSDEDLLDDLCPSSRKDADFERELKKMKKKVRAGMTEKQREEMENPWLYTQISDGERSLKKDMFKSFYREQYVCSLVDRSFVPCRSSDLP
eukprot:g30844.t1